MKKEMTDEGKSWFEKGWEEYLVKLYKENEERQAARFKRLQEKSPDIQGMLICSKEDFEKFYPGVEY